MTCVLNSLLPEPILFTDCCKYGIDVPCCNSLDYNCIVHKHKTLYGTEAYIPVNQSHSDIVNLLEFLPKDEIPEYDKDKGIKHYINTLTPFVLKNSTDISFVESWTDNFLSSNEHGSSGFRVNPRSGDYQNGGFTSELIKQTPVPSILSTIKSCYQKTTFWYKPNRGTSVTRSRIHRDAGNFFVMQLHGSKNVVLIDHKYSLNLYADFSDRYNLIPFEKHVDIIKYPEVKNVRIKFITTEPGDLVYIPYHYWHYIETAPNRNIALTFQFKECKNIVGPKSSFSYDSYMYQQEYKNGDVSFETKEHCLNLSQYEECQVNDSVSPP